MKKHVPIIFAAISLVLIVTILITVPSPNASISRPPPVEQMQSVLHFDSTAALLRHFEETAYVWPINKVASIPDTLIRSMPNDIHTIKDVKTRKSVFIRVMLPIILSEQKRIRNNRQTLKLALQSEPGNTTLGDKLNGLFSEYNINENWDFPKKRKSLLHRFDELPLTLILAQAAIESGWGTSRFTRLGNSLFGEWTYKTNEGIIPKGRDAGKTHRIKTFPSLRDSIASYIKNINRNKAYRELRQLRAEMREKHQALDAKKLASGLQRYSQKGQAYVDTILAILNSTEFKLIETLNLDTHLRL